MSTEVYEYTDEEYERYETADSLLSELRGSGIDFRLVDGKVRYRPASALSERGVSELQRVKAKLYESLREEDEREAAHEARLAAAPETDVMPDDEYDEFCELTADQRDALWGWIGESLEPSDRRCDSYELKHVFERSPEGFYITDAQFRAAMWLSGFFGRRYPGRRYEDCESRYYYVRPKPEGLIRKLVEAGVLSEWAVDAILGTGEGSA